MKEYREYGWENSEFTNAHAYLIRPIIDMLPVDGSPILDLGCGNGAIANFLILKGYNVYGTDASIKGIEIANKINPGHFFVQDFTSDDLPVYLKSITFKTVISTEVIEHLYDPKKYVSFIKLILRSGGIIIISTPYHGYLKNLALSIFNKWDDHHTPLWEGGHIKFWSKKTLSSLLEQNGFKVIGFKGTGRIPFFWKSMILLAKKI